VLSFVRQKALGIPDMAEQEQGTATGYLDLFIEVYSLLLDK
jgi:hypothetical protein